MAPQIPYPAVQATQGSLPKNRSNADPRSQLDAAPKELRLVVEQSDIQKPWACSPNPAERFQTIGAMKDPRS